MAHGIKTGGKKFEKGNTFGAGNRTGKVSVPVAVRNENRKLVEKILSKYLAMDYCDLVSLVKHDSGQKKHKVTIKLPALDVMVINIIIKCVEAGDYSRLGFILDRLIGKVKIEADVNIDSTVKVEKYEDYLRRISNGNAGSKQGTVAVETVGKIVNSTDNI